AAAAVDPPDGRPRRVAPDAELVVIAMEGIGARALAARARITGNDTDPQARQRTAERRSELRRRDRRQQLADDGFHLVCLRDVRQAREPPLEALGRAEGRKEGAQPDAVAGGE